MKRFSAFIMLAVVSVLPLTSVAATSISEEQAQTRQSVGVVSVNKVGETLSGLTEMMSDKAEAKGASSFRVLSANTGDSSHMSAELYK